MGPETGADLTAELEAWWKENAAQGESFEPDKATAQLLQAVKRYELALRRIAEKAEDQKALMDHLYKTILEQVAENKGASVAFCKRCGR